MTTLWETNKTHIHIAPQKLTVVAESKDSTSHGVTAVSLCGVSLLIEYSAVGSLSAASTRRQEPVKQSLGVVETGLDVWARPRRVPQAEKSWRVGDLKLKAVTNPTP